MEFKGKKYEEVYVAELFDFIDSSKVGQFTWHYGQCVFHTEKGFYAAYGDDLENCWEI